MLNFLLLICAIFFATACGERARSAAADVPKEDVRRLPSTRLADLPDVMVQTADHGRVLGLDSARVNIVVISDYACVDCRSWFAQILPQLQRTYIDSGRVRLTWAHYPLREHSHAVGAAAAAMCASVQGKFWDASRALFTTQDQWRDATDAPARVEALSLTAGIDSSALHDCIVSRRMLRQVRLDIDWIDQHRYGTPLAVLVAERRVGDPMSWSALRSAIDQVK